MAFAEDHVGGGCRPDLRQVEADMLGIDELEILEELVHGACAPAQQQDDGGFVDVKGGDWAAIGGSDDVDEGAALGFFCRMAMRAEVSMTISQKLPDRCDR